MDKIGHTLVLEGSNWYVFLALQKPSVFRLRLGFSRRRRRLLTLNDCLCHLASHFHIELVTQTSFQPIQDHSKVRLKRKEKSKFYFFTTSTVFSLFSMSLDNSQETSKVIFTFGCSVWAQVFVLPASSPYCVGLKWTVTRSLATVKEY